MAGAEFFSGGGLGHAGDVPLVPRVLGREQVVSRLLALEARGELDAEHVRLVASSVGVSRRTVRRWLQAGREGRTGPVQRERFRITDELHGRLVAWCGNAAAVHRDLVAEAARVRVEGNQVPDVPSLATLHRAIRLDLNPGQRAALAGGEPARRRHDVHLRRPRLWRNACWEADHKHVPVEVLLDGELVFPWVTWFIDCATEVIPGAAITPHQPSRDAVLAALRIALVRDEDSTGPYGPIGGLPSLVRIDRGADFLSATVSDALGHFAVPVQDLPAYRPDLKGSIENLNRCAERMRFASMPRYTHAPSMRLRPGARPGRVDEAAALPFAEFVRLLLEWITWWNTEHTSQALDGRTPLEAWRADPTPVEDVDRCLLHRFTLADDGRIRTLTASGVRFNKRYYVGEWMHGEAEVGCKVRIRFIPHHDHEIEVFEAASGKYLGPAHPCDEATDTQRRAHRRRKAAEKRRLARAMSAAAEQTRTRYAAVTEVKPPRRLGSLSAAEADRAADSERLGDAAELALPDLIPPAAPPDHWRTPASLRAKCRPAPPGDGSGISQEGEDR
ncbi:Mu transposase C-terminal domain-containing protein [Streptomyces sp. NBC_01017]|uniref:Mu transposase C-terminal domain-containing protein n=1 Tax=Streptomyces sp. NBC_01017 TaxID=2903721 RepID=UPI0038686EF4|nr:Mu transposase C-terminal domain-containing protein [Streptomyces sp. NBC_01017]WSV35400.1 Mu transposase C-terminal domain-containing protein [Streptomyces sp. NBC_01017]